MSSKSVAVSSFKSEKKSINRSRFGTSTLGVDTGDEIGAKSVVGGVVGLLVVIGDGGVGDGVDNVTTVGAGDGDGTASSSAELLSIVELLLLSTKTTLTIAAAMTANNSRLAKQMTSRQFLQKDVELGGVYLMKSFVPNEYVSSESNGGGGGNTTGAFFFGDGLEICIGIPSSTSCSSSSGSGAKPLCFFVADGLFCCTSCSDRGTSSLDSFFFTSTFSLSSLAFSILLSMARDRGSFELSTGSRGLMLTFDTRDVYVVPLAIVFSSDEVDTLREDLAFLGLGGGSGSLESCLVAAFSSGEGFLEEVRYVFGMEYVKPAPLEIPLEMVLPSSLMATCCFFFRCGR